MTSRTVSPQEPGGRGGATPVRVLVGTVLLAGAAAGLLLLGRGETVPAPTGTEGLRVGVAGEGGAGSEGTPSGAGGGVLYVEGRGLADPGGGTAGETRAAPDLASFPGGEIPGVSGDVETPTSPADEMARRLREGKEELGGVVALEICRELLTLDDLNLDHVEIACNHLSGNPSQGSAELLREAWQEYAAGGEAPAWEVPILDALIQPWPPHGKVLIDVFPTLSEERKAWCLSRVIERRPEVLRRWVNRLHRASEDRESEYDALLHQAYEAYATHPRLEGPGRRRKERER